MKNKTCGDCRYYREEDTMCIKWRYEDITSDAEVCREFEPPTNGDKVRQMSDEELAKKLVYRKHVQKMIGEMGYSYVSFASTIIKNEEFETKPEAIAATIEELKKEYTNEN